MCKMNRISIA